MPSKSLNCKDIYEFYGKNHDPVYCCCKCENGECRVKGKVKGSWSFLVCCRTRMFHEEEAHISGPGKVSSGICFISLRTK